jgi:hypothetical protein
MPRFVPVLVAALLAGASAQQFVVSATTVVVFVDDATPSVALAFRDFQLDW